MEQVYLLNILNKEITEFRINSNSFIIEFDHHHNSYFNLSELKVSIVFKLISEEFFDLEFRNYEDFNKLIGRKVLDVAKVENGFVLELSDLNGNKVKENKDLDNENYFILYETLIPYLLIEPWKN